MMADVTPEGLDLPGRVQWPGSSLDGRRGRSRIVDGTIGSKTRERSGLSVRRAKRDGRARAAHGGLGTAVAGCYWRRSRLPRGFSPVLPLRAWAAQYGRRERDGVSRL